MEVSSHDMVMILLAGCTSCSYGEMPTHDLAIVEIRRRQCGYDTSLVHDIAALSHGTDHVEILLDENNGDVGLAIQVDYGAGDILHNRWLDAFRRLVEQDQRRIADHDATDCQLLLLAAGQGSGLLAAPLGADRKSAIDPRVVCWIGLAVDHCADLEVFLDTHARKNVATLRHIADAQAGAAMRDQRAHILPLENDGAFGRRQKPDQRPHQRRLADAVAADHGDDLTFAYIHVDALQHRLAAIAGTQLERGEGDFLTHGPGPDTLLSRARPQRSPPWCLARKFGRDAAR